MRAFKNYIFAPGLLILGIATLVSFQNCSSKVGFGADPSATETAIPVNGESVTTGTPNGATGVVIQLNEVPKDSNNDSGATIDYEINTPTGTITDVKCQLNGVDVNCGVTDHINLPPTGKGPQTFTITATNSDGKTATETVTWTIYDKLVQMTKDFVVNVTGDKVDIIINIDNSGSMKYEQESMAGRVANFMQPFAGLDYHIAITTTSPVGNSTIWKPSLNYVDGKFVPLDNSGTYCIKSSQHSLQQAQDFISNNVVRSLYLLNDDGSVFKDQSGRSYPEGNGYERGIFTTRRSLERDMAGQQGDSDCIRNNDIPKHVILISDEDETIVTEDSSKTPLPDQNKSDGANLRQYVSANYGSNTVFKFHSIIVDPYTNEGAQCLKAEGRRYGNAYAKLSKDTGGYIGSVCAADYSTQLGEIGKIISDSQLAQALGCVAVANNNDYGSVVNLANGQEISVNYEFNGDKVEFEQLLGQGQYRITYYCYQ